MRGERSKASPAELAMCRRWEEIHAAIERKEGPAALIRLTGFMIDYPEDGVAHYHAQQHLAAARAAGEVA